MAEREAAFEQKLQHYLYQNIPLAGALGVQVLTATEFSVRLKAPLAPNINHKSTVFGGSLQAVATLCCWMLFYLKLKAHDIDAEIVIQKSEVKYLKPVTDDFTVECCFDDQAAFTKFLKMLRRKGRGRLQLSAAVLQQGSVALNYSGDFAVIAKS